MDHEKLIELVKNYPLLYDLCDRKYSDNMRRDAAWREIAKQLHVRDQDCKKTWACLRDAFRRSIKKRNGQANTSTKKWKYEDEMSFILPFIRERQSSQITYQYDNGDFLDENGETNDRLKDEEASLDSSVSMPVVVVSTLEETDGHPRESTPPLPKRKRVMPRSKPKNTASSTLLKYILQKNERPVNDIDQFFNSISTTVQSFPLKDRAIAKAKVFNVISQMELEILNRSSPDVDTDSQTSP